MSTVVKQKATLFRMVTDEHVCPFGLKAKDLLERKGYQVDDQRLTSRSEADSFKEEQQVKTTPQIFINNTRIGGYEALRRHLDMPVQDTESTSYKPVIAIFSVAFLMALATNWALSGSIMTMRSFEFFIAISMCILAIQKLQNLESFSNMFLGYDLLAKRVVRYAYVYPFGEALAGILMIAGALLWLAIPVALFIGTVGAVSVVKAVYIDKRELKCACVGGDSNVPLGFISLTENIMMMVMAVWMLIR
ncbi:MauE/DoxX family redox-associated membrane protein [Granulosicoccus antarcticus]|uniref:Methylamine utilization protein MauE n=1 Tax=Granulosicoccus antarcticus IMCC3135 TaxID=1192854 RepID=A0A2Z2NXZ9_9GAMM|nr:MauE/DoxX family redox-associated membrane protein [Granulosicoccus antarcticus]ASJ73700.1 hypothetical protein IMCC3135_18105 [Granulosicoccus antarcticus IMCC3135]